MSASITNYFKPAQPKKAKKRKLNNDDDQKEEDKIDPIQPSKSNNSNSKTTENPITHQPVKKHKKIINHNDDDDDKKTESDDNENGEIISFANCYKLLDKSWSNKLSIEFKKAYFVTLCRKLQTAQDQNIQIFPKITHVFRAFELCKWSMLKAVIVGQDP